MTCCLWQRKLERYFQIRQKQKGEERINLAMAGFGLGVDENRQSFKKKVRDFPKEKIPTAANLLTTASK
ncbi:hypothetical protein TNCV_109721 [Trichonephila clavipes]|nr:hypothetical protein TNCV_109721 [Trichonephila clavipes]